MKQAPLIINAVLLIAVGFLMIQHFKGPRPAASANNTNSAASVAAGNGEARIVFVNADSLLEKYELFKQKKEALTKKEKDADSALKARGKALEKEFMQAQQKVQEGLMTPNQVQQLEQQLSQKQQRLMADQDRITKELVDETQKIQDELQKSVKDLLAAIRKEKGYDYILSYGPGTGVLMVNDSLDITELVLERLNQKKEN